MVPPLIVAPPLLTPLLTPLPSMSTKTSATFTSISGV